MTAPYPQDVPNRLSGAENQARDSRKTKLTQLLDMQDVVYADVMNRETGPQERAQAVRAWDVIEDRIRILRGKVKPGSKNISVREVSPTERAKLSEGRRATDYMTDAMRTMAQSDVPPPK